MIRKVLHGIIGTILIWIPWGVVLYAWLCNPIKFVFFTIPLLLVFQVYFPRTLMWIRIGFDMLFRKPQTIRTKGYRFAKREYVSDLSRKELYSRVFFDDDRLKKEYYFFESDVF